MLPQLPLPPVGRFVSVSTHNIQMLYTHRLLPSVFKETCEQLRVLLMPFESPPFPFRESCRDVEHDRENLNQERSWYTRCEDAVHKLVDPLHEGI